MTRRSFLCAAALLTLLGLAARLHNALSFPVLSGYDAFAHFGYIWFLAETGRVPDPTAGWEFFQPPAYYAWMATVWNALPGVDAIARLRAGSAVVAALGMATPLVALGVVRRAYPADRLVQLLAFALALFLPVHLYSAGFIGNEGLCAAACALAVAQLLRTLAAPSTGRVVLLGLLLGAAMLAKFTGIVVVGAAFGAIALKALAVARGCDAGAAPSAGAPSIAAASKTCTILAATMLLACGWFYGRNVVTYGNPFQMSRDKPFLAQIENNQLQGERRLPEYLLFDPLIVYRPQWPRGLSLDRPRPEGTPYSALRESIPTGLYANTWFDGFGGFLLQPVTQSEATRRAGQMMLALGLLPTLAMLAGFALSIGKLRREGWDDTIVVMLLLTLAMAAIVVQGTRTVPTQAAVKATYLMPASVAFVYWFATGAHALLRRRPRSRVAAAALAALTSTASLLVFSYDVVLDGSWMTRDEGNAPLRNLTGVLYYAAGDLGRARPLFASAAAEGSPLAQENLADLELREGRVAEALQLLRSATKTQQAAHDAATDPHRRHYLEVTLAEYANSRAVLLHRLGARDEALAETRESRRLDATIPESWYDGAVLLLEAASKETDATARIALVDEARRDLDTAAKLDPAFVEARRLEAVAAVLATDCRAGVAALEDALAERPAPPRAYPMETGPGDQNAAGVNRRRRIEDLAPAIEPRAVLAGCRNAAA